MWEGSYCLHQEIMHAMNFMHTKYLSINFPDAVQYYYQCICTLSHCTGLVWLSEYQLVWLCWWLGWWLGWWFVSAAAAVTVVNCVVYFTIMTIYVLKLYQYGTNINLQAWLHPIPYMHAYLSVAHYTFWKFHIATLWLWSFCTKVSRVTHGMELRTPYLELLMGQSLMQNTALVTHAWGGTMQNVFCINPSSYIQPYTTFMGRIYAEVDKSMQYV